MKPIDIPPEQLAAEMAEYSRKLGHGLTNLLNAQEVDTGVTPRQAVYCEDKLTLYRYQGVDEGWRNPVPLLIVYALVNRPYMTDIQEDRSTLRNLLVQGQDIYLIDWGYPDDADAGLTLDDYINGYIDRCVDQVCEASGQQQINMLGICQGGVFSLCYTALHQSKVKNLITMVTPVDFQTPGNLLSSWARRIDIDLLVDTLGNVPGELLNWIFLSLKPFTLIGQKYVNMVDLLEDETRLKNFLRMEKWIFDSPDQAGESFRQFVKDFFQNNGLINGGVRLGEWLVELKKITCPLLNIYGEQDHLVPPDASRALRDLTGSSDYSEVAFPGGHIGIYVSSSAQKTIPPAIGRWLNERS